MFGGGTGAGVIAPIAFLVISGGNVRTIQLVEHVSPVDQRYQRSAGPCGPHQRPNQKGQARNPAGISGQIHFPNRNPAQSGLFN